MLYGKKMGEVSVYELPRRESGGACGWRRGRCGGVRVTKIKKDEGEAPCNTVTYIYCVL